MAAIKRTSVFSIKECYAFPLLLDVEGQRPVYGKGVKVPGIQTISETKNYTSESLPGDGTVIDTQSEFESLEASAEYAQLDHVAKALIEGGLNRLTDDQSQYVFGGSDSNSPFMLKFRATKVGAGAGKDFLVTYYKCTAGTSSGDTANAAFKTNTFDLSVARIEGKVVHPDGNDFLLEQIRDTADAGPIDPNKPLPDEMPAIAATQPTLVSTTPAALGSIAAGAVTLQALFSEELHEDYMSSAYFNVWSDTLGRLVEPTSVTKNGSTAEQVDVLVTLAAGTHRFIINRNVASDAARVPLNTENAIEFTVT